MKTIGMIGTRRRNTFNDRKDCIQAFEAIYEAGDILVSGGCPKGGDNFAEFIAKEDGIGILIFYPNWNKYHRAAGFVRNSDIADNSDVLIACVAEDRKGGTEDTIKKFIKKFSFDEKAAVKEGKLILV